MKKNIMNLFKNRKIPLCIKNYQPFSVFMANKNYLGKKYCPYKNFGKQYSSKNNILNIKIDAMNVGDKHREESDPMNWKELEGLQKDATIYVLRDEKLKDLKEKIDKDQIAYIRSPSATGKTSLAKLIERSEEWKEKYDIIYIQFAPGSSQESIDRFKKVTGYENPYDALINYKGDKHLLYILDDAQNLFPGKEDQKSLLDSLKTLENVFQSMEAIKKKVHVLLLATHGEQTLGSGESKITLNPLGIDYLLFSKTEYESAIKNLKDNTGLDLTDLPLSFFKMTNGHPGLLVHSFSLIYKRFKASKPTKKLITDYILSNEFLESLPRYKFYDVLTSPLSDPNLEKIRKKAFNALERLSNSPTQTLKIRDPTLSSQNQFIVDKEEAYVLMKIGACIYLEEKVSITWAFDYLRIFFLRYFAPLKPSKEYKDIHDFTIDFLRLLPYSSLKERLDPQLYGRKSVIDRPSERFYQNIFFMQAMKLIGKGIFPEVGTKNTIENAVEFKTSSHLKKKSIDLKKKTSFRFVVDQNALGDDTQIAVTDKDFLNNIKEGDTIFVYNGPTFYVTKVTDSYVDTILKKEGKLKGNDKIYIVDKEGFIDFYVNSIHQYGFEFLIDGSLRERHYERLCLNGDYSFLKLKNFQLIDFTTSKPQKETLEKYKGITFVYFHSGFKKATINYFRRNQVQMDLLSNDAIAAKRGITKDGNKFIYDENTYFNLRNGSYDEEFTIDLEKNQSSIKSLTLQLFEINDKDMRRLATKKINDVPILLETFKERISELFKQHLDKSNKEFIIQYEDTPIENDNDLFNIPENSSIDIILK